MRLDETCRIIVIMITVSNIGALGVETNLREALQYLYNVRDIFG